MHLPPELLLAAYRRGLFPMAIDDGGTIGWFSPDPRAVIPLDDRFHVPHGLRRVLKARCPELLNSSPGPREGEPPGPEAVEGAPACPRSDRGSARRRPAEPRSRRPASLTITIDLDFERVIRACAKRREGTWISEPIVAAYCALHRLGHAHSIEVRLLKPGAVSSSVALRPSSLPLVGGLYGVHVGAAFFGESMFHRAPDASKVALVALVQRLRRHGFLLLDTQWLTPHLATFGAYAIGRRQYLRRLARAVARDCRF